MPDGHRDPDGYVCGRLLGSSIQGDVYEAVDQAGRAVAVRVIGPQNLSDPKTAQALDRDVRASLRLDHPHIVRSIAALQRDDRRYVVMELVNGPTLRDFVREHGPMSEHDAVVALTQLAQALGYAWRHGIAHHGISPDSVLVEPARSGIAEGSCAKLADFGLSRLRMPGEEIGFPIVPKAVRDQNGWRDDIHALAATICWVIGPNDERKTPTGRTTTFLVRGVSLETMQLLGCMLDHDRPPEMSSWERIIDRARTLSALRRSA